MPGNMTFLGLMDYAQMGRDGFSGRIDLNGFMKVMDLYSEVHGLDCWDKMEMLDKLIVVTRIEEDKRAADSPMKGQPQQGGRPTIGGRR